MNYQKLRELNNKLYFTVNDVAKILNINVRSASVLCTRYIQKDLFIRIKYNFYILKEKWERISLKELFKIANYLQVPSYISFMTALSYYEITTQIQRDFIECACLRRTKTFTAQNMTFNYYKLKKECYSGFQNINGIFIAEKEKAFLDSLYLYSLGKYSFDISSLDLDKLNSNKIKTFLKNYPHKTEEVYKKLCRIL